MTERKWTPGPWDADDMAVRTNDKALVSLVYGNGDGSLFKANAHLIAAAPELYEALKLFVDATPKLDMSDPCMVERVNRARAALAKARGEK